jgi:hypothetical protein
MIDVSPDERPDDDYQQDGAHRTASALCDSTMPLSTAAVFPQLGENLLIWQFDGGHRGSPSQSLVLWVSIVRLANPTLSLVHSLWL